MILVAALALVIGGALGLLGGGGSVLTVPMLMWAGQLDERSAISASLLVVGVTSAVAAIRHQRAGNVVATTAAVFALPSMVGAFAGGRVAGFIPASMLLAGVSVLMLGSAVAMWRGRARAEPLTPTTPRSAPTLMMVALGAAVGFIAGLVGAGGGFLIVPALTLLGGLQMRRAVGTSLVIIALQSAAGFVGHLGQSAMDVRMVSVVVVMSVVGAWIGAGLAEHTQPKRLRAAFAVVVALIAVLMLAKLAFGASTHVENAGGIDAVCSALAAGNTRATAPYGLAASAADMGE